MTKNIISLMRPEQWLKNIFVLMPLFFDGQLMNPEKLMHCIVAFIAFCFAASGVYCLNDIYDADADRIHPVKCKRPIASGALSKSNAIIVMIMCFIFCATTLFISSLIMGPTSARSYYIFIYYIILNIGYTVYLKRLPIVDMFLVAFCYQFRLLAGGYTARIRLSRWIILMTFLIALLMAIAKRRDDMIIRDNTGITVRKNLNAYNLPFMNQILGIVASITIVCYIMFTLSEEVIERHGTKDLYITSVFVLAGIIRYLQITVVEEASGSPTHILMKDRFIQFCIVAWVVAFFIIIYFL